MRPLLNKRKEIRHIRYAVSWWKSKKTLLKNKGIKVTEKAIALS
jgi:hypothetical protein